MLQENCSFLIGTGNSLGRWHGVGGHTFRKQTLNWAKDKTSRARSPSAAGLPAERCAVLREPDLTLCPPRWSNWWYKQNELLLQLLLRVVVSLSGGNSVYCFPYPWLSLGDWVQVSSLFRNVFLSEQDSPSLCIDLLRGPSRWAYRQHCVGPA